MKLKAVSEFLKFRPTTTKSKKPRLAHPSHPIDAPTPPPSLTHVTYFAYALSSCIKGIVGLPNVGKSTLFNALTGGATAQAASAYCRIVVVGGGTTWLLPLTLLHRVYIQRGLSTYLSLHPSLSHHKSSTPQPHPPTPTPSPDFPFCTIEPNVGVVEVPDARLQTLAGIAGSENVLPAALEFVDIAGLVKGASQGEGLGNKFLANIRECDAIVQVGGWWVYYILVYI